MFVDYSYFSSFSDTWLAHCDQFAAEMVQRFGLGNGSRVVEIGSNDGALQGCFAERGIAALGVEPAENVAQAARAKGLPTETAFFGERTARRLAGAGWSADLVVATNVLAHVPDINDFVAGLRQLLKPDGLLVVEFPHLLNLIREVQFDTIYHEHFTYLSLLSVRTILKRHGLILVDVERQPVHGGSLRIFAAPAESARVARSSVEVMMREEVAAGLDRSAGYDGFQQRVDEMRDTLAAFLARSRREGRHIVGYGAAAKGATLLNHLGATPAEIAFVVDRNPAKQGLLLPGQPYSGPPGRSPDRSATGLCPDPAVEPARRGDPSAAGGRRMGRPVRHAFAAARSDMKYIQAPIGARPAALNRRMLYIPNGIAHGCQGLEDEIGISYRMSTFYHPEAAAGVRWDHPACAVIWPSVVTDVAARGRSHLDLHLS